jgi:hypothetical protein
MNKDTYKYKFEIKYTCVLHKYTYKYTYILKSIRVS